MKIRLWLISCLCCVCFGLAGEARAEEVEAGKESFSEWLKGEGVEFYGSVEFDYRTEEGFDSAEGDSSTTSNKDVSVDLGLIVHANPWLDAGLAVGWDDEAPMEIDEARVTLGNPELFPVYVSGGKMTLPFGRYETVMLSDSLPQEIGETKQEAILLGLEWRGLQMGVFAFDGSTLRGDEGDGLKSYGGNIGYRLGREELGLLVGASWVDNLEDSDGLADFFAEEKLILKDNVPALAAYSQLTLGPFILFGEYVESLERPRIIDEEEVETLDRQKAWAGELAVAFELAGIELECGLTYGETAGVGDLLPKKRYGGAVSVYPLQHLRLVIEYLEEEDYPISKEGTGDRADIVTFQLAAEF